ncbi:MAG: DinB family protein, partial [Anaerolineales bacterium]
MATHPLVLQLRFTRKEFVRGLKDVTAEEATRHFGPMNSISWIIGHLAWQEQLYWLTHAQGLMPASSVREQANGAPLSTPPLEEVWEAWRTVTKASDPWLDALTSKQLTTHTKKADGEPYKESIGSRIQRTTHHYWFHLGEAQAIRQMLGHTGLPAFVGDQHGKAP